MSNGYGKPPAKNTDKEPDVSKYVGMTLIDQKTGVPYTVAAIPFGKTTRYVGRDPQGGVVDLWRRTWVHPATQQGIVFSQAGDVVSTKAGMKYGPEPTAIHWEPDPNIPGLINLVDSKGNILDTRTQPSGGGAGAGPTGPGPFGGPAQADLLPTQVPGVYVNPNTGATIDLSVPEIKGTLVPLVDPTTGQPVPGMFLNPNTGAQIDLRPEQLRDPLGVANVLLRQYESLVDIGQMKSDDAWRRFNQQFSIAQEEFDRWSSTEDVRLRGEAENRMRQETNIAAQNAATSRAREAAAVMSSSMPGLTGLNLPLLGKMPVQQFSLNQLFNQGQGPMPAPLPFIGPGAAAPTMPTFSELPPLELPPSPDLLPLLKTAAPGVQF